MAAAIEAEEWRSEAEEEENSEEEAGKPLTRIILFVVKLWPMAASSWACIEDSNLSSLRWVVSALAGYEGFYAREMFIPTGVC